MRSVKTYIWQLVAKELTRFRVIGNTEQKAWYPLFRYAKTKPYFHLDGYMQRHWLIRHPARKDKPGYGTFRNLLRYLYPLYARFHFILRSDDERHPHNHPFPFTSMIMSGWYTEEITHADGTVEIRTYRTGDVNYKPQAGVYHRITEVSPQGVLTLVIMGRRTGKSWGFLVNGKHIAWDKYLGVNDV